MQQLVLLMLRLQENAKKKNKAESEKETQLNVRKKIQSPTETKPDKNYQLKMPTNVRRVDIRSFSLVVGGKIAYYLIDYVCSSFAYVSWALIS